MAHTPGPWEWDELDNGNTFILHGAHDYIEAPILMCDKCQNCWGSDKRCHTPKLEDRIAIAAVPDLLAVAEFASNAPAEAQDMMKREGFVLDDLDDRWQKLAFTLYNRLVAIAYKADAAIAAAKGEA